MNALGRASLSSVLKVLLDVAWYATMVLGVVVALDALVGVGGPGPGRLDLEVHFDLDPGAYRILSESLGVEHAFIGGAVGKLVFGTHRVSLLLVYVGVLVVWFAAALAIIYELRQVVRTLVAGEPFARANAARIRFIGLVIILMEIAKVAILTGFSLFVRNNFTIEGLTLSVIPDPDLGDLGVIFLGLVVLVIAAVFRQGIELREEQELTV